MSLSKYLAKIAESSEKPLQRLAASGNEAARSHTLWRLEKALWPDAKSIEMIQEMKPKGVVGHSLFDAIGPRPGVHPSDLKDFEAAIKLKANDNARHREWTALGQPSLKEMDDFNEAASTLPSENLDKVFPGGPDEIKDSLRKLQKIYGYVYHRQPNFPDAIIENKIPGFTAWMRKKKLEQGG